MVQMALEMSGEIDPNIPISMLDFLADKTAPIDVRLAIINGLGWNFYNTTTGSKLYEHLIKSYKVQSSEELIEKLDAGTLAVYAYAVAMSNYFEVTEAMKLARRAAEKNNDNSFSVKFVASLIAAQIWLDLDWSMISKGVNNSLNDSTLQRDMRQEAIDRVMRYINLYSIIQ
ncbi:MAG: hypothetical protein J6Y72_02410 [Bacteroidales bacterium]|nr:hypothetical protein [Bacteroidales bacterium]